MSGGLGRSEEVLDGIEHGAARRARARQDQRRRAARRQRPHRARAAGAFPRHRRDRAFHRIHGRGQPQRLAAGAGGALEGAAAARIRARWPLSAARARNIAARSRERHAFADGQGEIGFISSVIAAILRRLLARAAVLGRLVLYLPVRDAGHDLRDATARRRER